MMFAREFAVSLADFLRIGAALDSEGFVVIVLRHTQAGGLSRPAPSFLMARSSLASRWLFLVLHVHELRVDYIVFLLFCACTRAIAKGAHFLPAAGPRSLSIY